MKRNLREKLNVKKAARFAVTVNALQVAAMIAVLLYAIFRDRTEGRAVEIAAIAAALLIVSWGAILDIREALNAGKIADQAQMLEEAYGQLEDREYAKKKPCPACVPEPTREGIETLNAKNNR